MIAVPANLVCTRARIIQIDVTVHGAKALSAETHVVSTLFRRKVIQSLETDNSIATIFHQNYVIIGFFADVFFSRLVQVKIILTHSEVA